MTVNLTGMAPLKLDSTVLAIEDLTFTPNIVHEPFHHSGNQFASVGMTPGASPAFRFKTPFLAAYTYMAGLKTKLATTVEIYFATYLNGLRQSGANHTKYELNTGGSACLYMTGATVAQNGVLMVEMIAQLLQSDGVTNPLKRTDSVSLPTLGTEPALHTLGCYALNGTRKDGAKSLSFQLQPKVTIGHHDGDNFPRTHTYMGGQPRLVLQHEDPLQMDTDLGQMGTNIATSVAFFFAGIDPTTHLRMTTGISITVAAGRAYPGELKFTQKDPVTRAVMIDPLSSTGTHPFVINTSATIP